MLLEILGQRPEDAIKRETSSYRPGEGVERSPFERLRDTVLGQTDAIQEAAGKKYVRDLEESDVGTALRVLDPTAEITKDTKKTDLAKLLKDTKAKDDLRVAILNTGYTDKTGSELMEMDESALRPILEQATDDKAKRDYNTNPAVIKEESRYKTEREDRISREEQARKDRISERMSNRELAMLDLDIKKQAQANELAMYDKKLAYQAQVDQRNKMAGIIAGLANLGAAFAI